MNKKNFTFTQLIEKRMLEFKNKEAFYKEVGINKTQMGRLLRGEVKDPNTNTLSKLEKITKISPEDIRTAYNLEFQNKTINKNTRDRELRIALIKANKADKLFHFFDTHQIIDVYFEFNEINYNSSDTIADISNYFNLTSKLIKENWSFSDYFKLIPSSLGKFHNERQDENLAKISFINEMQRLIDNLKKDKNFVYVGTFNKTYQIINRKPKKYELESHSIVAPILHILISNVNEEKVRTNLVRREILYEDSKSEIDKKIRDIKFKINEREILEEELIEAAIESDHSDRYAQDQIDAFKDEGGLAELFNKE